ncbi:group 1 glycosyl transferase [Calothrix sp. NIES-4071]|nr:group 1 glycosyl transferase [Calothrix sp. NIES-4071]BAZ56258.1 group 1 glycosyl transferase [Calothrix sp. NIES-4105]
MKTQVLVAQLGARKHYQEPALFHRWGILDRLYTDFYSGDSALAHLFRHPKIYHYLPNPIKRVLERYDSGLKNAKVIHFPRFGYKYVQSLKTASPQQASQIFVEGGQNFCQQIIKHIIQYGIGQTNTIYGFNSACLELFTYAKERGIRCILDQTLADYSLVHELLLEEEKRWSGWSLIPFTVSKADVQLREREHHEQDMADNIICGSSFVKNSLIIRGVDPNKISVIPFGRVKDEKEGKNQHKIISIGSKSQEKLKILFVGSVGLRKGIPYLLEALRQIKGKILFDCKIVGSIEIKAEYIAEYSDVSSFTGRLPRSQIKDLYIWADVFVLPSLCEGSAMVTYEALSLGVPIITTYNSGSVVRDGVDGYIVPIRDAKAIAQQLLKIYEIKINQHQISNFYGNKMNTLIYLQNLLQDSEIKLEQILSSI